MPVSNAQPYRLDVPHLTEHACGTYTTSQASLMHCSRNSVSFRSVGMDKAYPYDTRAMHISIDMLCCASFVDLFDEAVGYIAW